MSGDEVRTVLDSAPQNPGRKIMIGVLANSNTIRWIPNARPNRCPGPEEMGNIFQKHPLALNLVHYNTSEPETLFEQMLEVLRLAGPNCHGLQLNIAWPEPRALANLVLNGWKTIALQIGDRALEAVNRSPEKLAKKVARDYKKPHRELIDYVLLDLSGGQGKPLNPEIMRPYLRALRSKNPALGLGVSGGLGPSTLDLVAPLIREFPNLSIDAEAGLRDKDDCLDPLAAADYLRSAIALFG